MSVNVIHYPPEYFANLDWKKFYSYLSYIHICHDKSWQVAGLHHRIFYIWVKKKYF